METFGFIQAAVEYEDPNPAPELRSLSELEWKASSSTMAALASVAVTVTVISGSPNAMAATSAQAVGSSGANVQAIQKALGIAADGNYGSKTEAAVTDFQIRQGLKQIDGVVGQETATALGLDEQYRPVGYVSTAYGNGLNIRSGPGLNYARIDGAVDGEYLSEDYSQVKYRDGYAWTPISGGGWVASNYTYEGDSSIDSGSERPVSYSPGTVRTNSGIGLNIRSGPGLGYGRIDGAGEGAYVGTTGNAVYADGYRWERADGGGWVATNYLN